MHAYLNKKEEDAQKGKKRSEHLNDRDRELDEGELKVEGDQGQPEIDADEVGEEVMEVDEEDDGQGGDDKHQAGSGFGRKLGRQARQKDEGGNEIEGGVDVLVAVLGQARAVGAEDPCGSQLHHSD